MHFYKNSQLPVSVAITPVQIAKNDCFDQVNRRFERLHESIWHARIFIVRQRITLQNSNDYLRQIDCLGFAGSATKRNAGCQDPAHCLSGFLSKAGSFLPGFIFSLCACKKSLRPALAFAYAEKGGDDSAAARGTSHLPFGRSFWKAVA